MPETSLPAPPGFNDLSKAEQVRYLRALWDQISEDPGVCPSPKVICDWLKSVSTVIGTILHVRIPRFRFSII